MLHLKYIQLYKLILYFDTVQSSPKYNNYLIYGLRQSIITANWKTIYIKIAAKAEHVLPLV